jgi:hypothetical protein
MTGIRDKPKKQMDDSLPFQARRAPGMAAAYGHGIECHVARRSESDGCRALKRTASMCLLDVVGGCIMVLLSSRRENWLRMPGGRTLLGQATLV